MTSTRLRPIVDGVLAGLGLWILCGCLLALGSGCGGHEVHVPDAGEVVAPRLDAGTGDCRDDYRITVEYCTTMDASGDDQAACWLSTVDHYEACIGPGEACITRCGLSRPAVPGCTDTCPSA